MPSREAAGSGAASSRGSHGGQRRRGRGLDQGGGSTRRGCPLPLHQNGAEDCSVRSARKPTPRVSVRSGASRREGSAGSGNLRAESPGSPAMAAPRPAGPRAGRQHEPGGAGGHPPARQAAWKARAPQGSCSSTTRCWPRRMRAPCWSTARPGPSRPPATWRHSPTPRGRGGTRGPCGTSSNAPRSFALSRPVPDARMRRRRASGTPEAAAPSARAAGCRKPGTPAADSSPARHGNGGAQATPCTISATLMSEMIHRRGLA